MLNKTPMQELFEKFGHLLPNIEDEYIEKEKQIIESVFDDGHTAGAEGIEMNGKEYYNQNYKNE